MGAQGLGLWGSAGTTSALLPAGLGPWRRRVTLHRKVWKRLVIPEKGEEGGRVHSPPPKSPTAPQNSTPSLLLSCSPGAQVPQSPRGDVRAVQCVGRPESLGGAPGPDTRAPSHSSAGHHEWRQEAGPRAGAPASQGPALICVPCMSISG